MALVGQEPILFSGSIWDNITYGLENCSLEEVRAAAEEADALGFIHELEGGFNAGRPNLSKIPFLFPENATLSALGTLVRCHETLPPTPLTGTWWRCGLNHRSLCAAGSEDQQS